MNMQKNIHRLLLFQFSLFFGELYFLLQKHSRFYTFNKKKKIKQCTHRFQALLEDKLNFRKSHFFSSCSLISFTFYIPKTLSDIFHFLHPEDALWYLSLSTSRRRSLISFTFYIPKTLSDIFHFLHPEDALWYLSLSTSRRRSLISFTFYIPKTLSDIFHFLHPEDALWYLSLSTSRRRSLISFTFYIPKTLSDIFHFLHPEDALWYLSLSTSRRRSLISFTFYIPKTPPYGSRICGQELLLSIYISQPAVKSRRCQSY